MAPRNISGFKKGHSSLLILYTCMPEIGPEMSAMSTHCCATWGTEARNNEINCANHIILCHRTAGSPCNRFAAPWMNKAVFCVAGSPCYRFTAQWPSRDSGNFMAPHPSVLHKLSKVLHDMSCNSMCFPIHSRSKLLEMC